MSASSERRLRRLQRSERTNTARPTLQTHHNRSLHTRHLQAGSHAFDFLVRWAGGFALGTGLAAWAYAGPTFDTDPDFMSIGHPLLDGFMAGFALAAMLGPLAWLWFRWRSKRVRAREGRVFEAEGAGLLTARIVFVVLLATMIVRDGPPGS